MASTFASEQEISVTDIEKALLGDVTQDLLTAGQQLAGIYGLRSFGAAIARCAG